MVATITSTGRGRYGMIADEEDPDAHHHSYGSGHRCNYGARARHDECFHGIRGGRVQDDTPMLGELRL